MFEWITDLIERSGYVGIFLLTFLENLFPPIPSEVIMPLAGFKSAQGELAVGWVILSGTLGSLAGAAVWYEIGARMGKAGVERFAARHGRWLTMCPPDVRRAEAWFKRHGAVAVLLGRLVPAVRSVISLPAGINRMPLITFLVFSALGTAAWTSLLVGAGYLLEAQYDRVAAYLNPASNLIFAALALWYLWRIVRFRGSADHKH